MPGRHPVAWPSADHPVRNLFLALLLANLLLFAWNGWVVPPSRPVAAVSPVPQRQPAQGASVPGAPGRDGVAVAPEVAASPPPPAATPLGAMAACVQIGPLAAAEAAAELGRSLASGGIAAIPMARDTQVWVGNWIQVGGFATPAAAEEARRRLVAGGLADAYLMQEGAEPVISLGVFREKERAERVASIARGLGFRPVSTNRYRPAVEYWLLARIPGTAVVPAEGLPLPRSGLLRVEPTECPLPDSEAGRTLAGGIEADSAGRSGVIGEP
jgi:hypothetical protein